MKKSTFLIAVFAVILAITQLWSQGNIDSRIPLIGEDAPSFIAESTTGKINFPDDFGKNWKIIFSHPADFTPVCTSELLEIAYQEKEFDKLGVKLFVVSTDDIVQHKSWVKSMERINYKSRDPVKINFPLIEDKNLAVSTKYGMIHPSTHGTKNVRGVFIISPENKIQAIFFYPMNVGRDIEEIKRTVIALQTAERGNVMTPANWLPGEDVLVPHVSSDNKPDENGQLKEGYNRVIWYMIFKEFK